jgi:hypothetical protein
MRRPEAPRHRHEVTVERIPQEFQGKPAPIHHSRLTVAEFRAKYPTQQILCPVCDTLIDISDLERVLDTWGPDAVIRYRPRHNYLPGESPPSRSQMREAGGSVSDAAQE